MRTSEDAIRSIAQQCARQNLTLAQARALFKAVYISDALAQTSGHVSKAADILGTDRQVIYRHLAAYRRVVDV